MEELNTGLAVVELNTSGLALVVSVAVSLNTVGLTLVNEKSPIAFHSLSYPMLYGFSLTTQYWGLTLGLYLLTTLAFFVGL